MLDPSHLGTSFVVSAYLQVVRHYNAIQTGVIFTAATVGIWLSSLAAGRLAKRFPQRGLIVTGFVTTIVGVVVLLALVKGHPGACPSLRDCSSSAWAWASPSPRRSTWCHRPFPETLQGEISGQSRQRVQPGVDARGGHRRHHPCRRPGRPQACLRCCHARVALIGFVGLGATILQPSVQSTQVPRTPD